MKRLFTLLLGATLGYGIQAQYLPNTDFETWKEVCDSSYQSSKSGKSGGAEGFRVRPGTEPMDWNGSSVNQKVWVSFFSQEKQETLITQGVSRNGTKSVVLTNKFVGVGNYGSNAPAFITFGTPWVYAVTTISNCDGGVYGGTNFTFRPDAIRGWYKRTPSEVSENAHIIAYLWKGTYSSEIRSHTTNDIKKDVDRVVMGKESGTGNGTLIASCDYSFSTTTNNEWQEIIVPLNYEKGQENTIPEKMNVIISSADYWTRDNIQDQSILEVDDVQYLYYSQLAELSYDGKSLDDFSKDKYEYAITANYDESKLSAKANGIGATVEKSYDEETRKLTITVKGNDFSVNTENFHTYTLEFKQTEEQIPMESTDYSGFLTVTVNDNSADPQITTIRLIKNTDASYSFALDNFILGAGEEAMPIGNILLKNLTVSEDGSSFTANQT
ncbi:calycin-like domain-containing protein, partial [Paraprevotella clara]|uniref:calycin-like domain-containing protein n=1 Tax=Paraprevotella clara TaxID=454154 RepID=UPI003AB5DCD4